MKFNEICSLYKDINPKDIQYLLINKYNIDLIDIVLNEDIEVDNNGLNLLIKRLKNDEPLQYIVGFQEFMGFKLYVDKRVLIPRPETEILIEKLAKYNIKNKKVLDLCCGSGAIGIAVYKLYNNNVTISDISKDALDVATKNLELYDINDIKVIYSDLFTNINDKFDIIISNPPYIATDDISVLDNNVKNFEPISALDGGSDGLEIIRNIAKESPRYLNEKGLIALEIGYNQGNAVKRILENNNFDDIDIIKDYNDYDRIVIAKYKWR